MSVSRWETGARQPSGEELRRIGELCGVTPAFFRAPARAAGLTAGDLHYRRKQRVKVSDLKRLEAVTNWLRIGADRLLDEVDLHSTLDIPSWVLGDISPEAAARHVRRYWNMPLGPVENLTELLELAGVIVIIDEFPATGLDGVSMWAGAWPVMYLSKFAPVDRRRFTMAHELGHLVLHRDDYDEQRGESEADRFAAELLTPADQIRPRLRRLTLREAAALKLEWRVSITALIQRAKQVEAITPDDATRLHKQRSYKGWTRAEPFSDHLAEETPSTLWRILQTLLDSGYTTSELGELLYVPNLFDHPAWWSDESSAHLHLVK